ncbi:hypothetical protein RclHR1_00070017 [Rhizophagus clarus]|uniref:Uncharacterized protein n=1 Tax=Rhizophagus clarus TaxID=94130 RepID=A0A2Z6SAG6_9GLOM|nr:hypothetical protein RclHR1_00070017 [Rhizophagus clarus]
MRQEFISGNYYTYRYPKSNNTNDNYPELDFWGLSKEFRKHLINPGISDSIKDLGFPNEREDLENFLKKKINDGIMGKENSIFISNIGNFSKMPSGNSFNNDEWKVSDMVFTQSGADIYSGISICVVSYEGNLNFTLDYVVGSVNHEKVVKFDEGLVKCLKFVAKNENVTLRDLAEL